MVQALYFDGLTPTAHPVELLVADDRILVAGQTVRRDEPLGAVRITDRIGDAPVFIHFGDDATCEVTDRTGFDSMLDAAGLGPGSLSLWERSRGAAAVAAAGMVVTLVVGYFVVLPELASIAANRMPASAVATLSDQTLSVLDSTVFGTSRVNPRRQAWLRQMSAELRLPDGDSIPLHLEFRSSPSLGANALALPSGTIVVTDALVELAYNDLEIMAVLAHEAGHVQARHGLRSLIQSSAVSILVAWYVGDISGLTAAAPTALLEARYSRELEREADYYAARVLTASDISLGFLIDILKRIDTARGDPTAGDRTYSYVSTHPSTAERVEELRLWMEAMWDDRPN